LVKLEKNVEMMGSKIPNYLYMQFCP